jgi:dihydrofolate reductase
VIISLVAAVDLRNGIGKEGRLPWHLRADLKLFKAITSGHHMLMGRKTYESIGRSLPGRTTIVLTRNEDFSAPGILRATSLNAAIELAEARGEVELMVVGGGQVFAGVLPQADQIYLTRVQVDAGCDVFFPDMDWNGWVELERSHHPQNPENDYAFDFSRLVRIDAGKNVESRP